ncbi:MAG: hypothetical protein AB7T06_07360 [Kofleriaceae bacterium]
MSERRWHDAEMARYLALALSLVACDNAPATPDAVLDACVATYPFANDCSDPCFDSDGPKPVMDIQPEELGIAAAPATSSPIRVALFLGIAPQPKQPLTEWTRDQVIDRWASLIRGTNTIFAQCGMHLEVEAVQVIALPSRLLVGLQANEPTSFGGHPPAGTPHPDLFDYEQHERLTAESMELFRYGKQFSSKNAISVFTVDSIIYYSNQMLSVPGGLSNPPNIYHHADDYPYRNSVLVVPEYGVCGSIPGPMRAATLGQEIGHMLLNTGGHVTQNGNLMNNGTNVTPEQCQRMSGNLSRLFGTAAVPDPGPPTE